MAYYYVKNGGTATGDGGRYASQQAGSFAGLGATGYYDNIQDAIDNATTTPTSGDYILVSDLHSFTAAGLITITGTSSNPFFVVSVDDANIDAGRTSSNRASETAGGTADVVFSNVFISGVRLFTQDDNIIQGNCVLYDCSLAASGSPDRLLSVASDGSSVRLIGGELDGGSNANTLPLHVQNGGLIEMINVDIVSTTSLNFLTDRGFVAGGGTIHATGCNLSAVTGTLISNVGSSQSVDDNIDVHFDMCEIAAGVSFTNETFKSYDQRALFTRCTDSSAAAEYQYHLHAFGGDVDDDSAIFRNEDPAFEDSAQKISYKIVTNTDASLGSPLWFEFPNNRWAELSAGASDTLRVYVTSNDVLTDKDIYIEVSYPDGTNKQVSNLASSAPKTVGGTLDLMAAGTTLTTDGSSSWTGALSNLYQIDVDTSGDAGSDTVPLVKVYITKPSTTIQISSVYELV